MPTRLLCGYYSCDAFLVHVSCTLLVAAMFYQFVLICALPVHKEKGKCQVSDDA